MAASPENLLEVLAQLPADGFRIYKIQLTHDREAASRLESVHALTSYSATGVIWYNFVNDEGITQPCLPWQPRPEAECAYTIEWSMAPRAVRATTNVSSGNDGRHR
ncbi:hypothetical protein [Paraburkholderia sp. GAS41]|uniref:hypothetical protein n=1 Tax=Paraburkholderia sp. GAS41 TaxID=3035134 RepID=UPI003D1FB80F